MSELLGNLILLRIVFLALVFELSQHVGESLHLFLESRYFALVFIDLLLMVPIDCLYPVLVNMHLLLESPEALLLHI